VQALSRQLGLVRPSFVADDIPRRGGQPALLVLREHKHVERARLESAGGVYDVAGPRRTSARRGEPSFEPDRSLSS
jgi:hypothetical protein